MKFGSAEATLFGVLCGIHLFASGSSRQAEGATIFHEWSRRFVDFVRENTPARMFLSAPDPPTAQQLIELHGYPCETHNVTTADGYILELHRIPYSPRPRGLVPKQRVPVIVMHGIFASSSDMVISPEVEDCLGFYLADRGYDVWLGNMRGNTYSKRHVSLTVGDNKFWEYSIAEIGMYDMAAIVDHILLTTSQQKVHHIGISLGSPALTVLLAKRPEYNKKIGVGIFLAPGGIFQRGAFRGLAYLLGPVYSFMQVYSDLTGGFPVIPYFVAHISRRLLPVLCHPRVDWFGLCRKGLYTLYGNDGGLITKEKMPLIMSVIPSPLSYRTMLHAFQEVSSGQFTEFDYGIGKNLQIYGTPNPPPYNFTNVQVPIAIFVGSNDVLSDPQDDRRLANSLPNVVDYYTIPHPLFTHVDITYAEGVGDLVYKRVVHILNTFSLH